jgi:peptidoglycan/LPS O-acetylase OafA/YrhL
MTDIKPFTALRGLFAIWVVAFHMSAMSPFGEVLLPIISRGYIAVDFFFMLSGFVLAVVYGHSIKTIRQYLVFLIKRTGRLYPLHILVIVAILLWLTALQVQWPWVGSIIEEGLLVHRWWIFHVPRVAINGPDWAMSTEVAACLLFPVIAMVTLRHTVASLLAATVSMVGVLDVARLHGWSLDISMANSPLPLIRCLTEFSLGMLAFRWQQQLKFLSSDKAIGGLALLAIGLLLLPGTDVALVALMWLLLAALPSNAGYIASWLSGRRLLMLGRHSYAIYLIQLPIILVARYLSHQFQGPTDIWFSFAAITFIGMVAVVPLVHGKFEQWSRRRIDEVAARFARAV